MKVTKADCVGCRDNFYNGNNSLGVSECWHLKTAKLETRYSIHIHTPMNIKSAYHKEEKPNCYDQDGFVALKAIPDHAK